MTRDRLLAAALGAVLVAVSFSITADAADSANKKDSGTPVKGYELERKGKGGYSYKQQDTIVYAPWDVPRQSPGGPFDHGFFFDSGVADSGIGQYGAQSPYMH